MRRLLLAACLGAGVCQGACAKPPVQVEPALPQLVPPPPPPRIVAVYEVEVEEPLPALAPEPSEESTQPAPPRPQRPKSPPEGEVAKTEPARA
jgi:hypothetical protein